MLHTPSSNGSPNRTLLPGPQLSPDRSDGRVDHRMSRYPADDVSLGDLESGFSKARVHIPQFRQSRRWARMHGCVEPPAAPNTARVDPYLEADLIEGEINNQILSKREVLFNQQRAIPKPAVARTHILTDEADRQSSKRQLSDSSSDSVSTSLIRLSTAECWRFVKPKVIRLPHSATDAWSHRRFKNRRVILSSRDESTSRRSSAVISLQAIMSADREDRLSWRDADTCKQAIPSVIHAKSTNKLKRRNYRLNDSRTRRNLSSSLTSSLHDPLKDATFSEECRKMLKDIESEKDWLRPVAGTNASTNLYTSPCSTALENLDSITLASANEPPLLEELSFQLQPKAREEIAIAVAEPVGTVLMPTDNSAHICPPRKPLCDSRNLARETFSGPPASTMIDLTTGSVQDRNTTEARSALLPDQSRAVTRLPSARSVMSTDTLGGIEAQVERPSGLGINSEIPRCSLNSSIGSLIDKYSGPPPRIPLPAVPTTEIEETHSDITESSADRGSLDLDSSKSSETSAEFTHHAIKGSRADKVRARRMQDLARSRNQSPESDLSKDQKEALNATRLLPTFDITEELDRFPAAPESRPSSTGNVSVRSSHRQHSMSSANALRPILRLSTMSSTNYRATRPQILSQSNIFVVVDSDPVTAHFRAGVMSTSPQLGYSPERRSLRYSQTSPNLRETIARQKRQAEENGTDRNSFRLNGERMSTPGQSSRLTNGHKRPATSDSRVYTSSGEDQSVRNVDKAGPQKSASKPKKRRRWNSSDINLIKLLQRDLEEYYATIQMQEDKIRWQTDQIQMMSKAFAPASRSRGMETRSDLQDSSNLPSVYRGSRPRRLGERNSWSGSEDLRKLRQDGSVAPEGQSFTHVWGFTCEGGGWVQSERLKAARFWMIPFDGDGPMVNDARYYRR